VIELRGTRGIEDEQNQHRHGADAAHISVEMLFLPSPSNLVGSQETLERSKYVISPDRQSRKRRSGDL